MRATTPIALLLPLLAACAASSGEAETATPPARPADCPDPARAAEAQAQYEEGRALLASCSDELCRKSVKGNAVANRAVSLLEAAAKSGNVDAQALYGKDLLGFAWMTDPSEPHAEERYVTAFMYLRLAARRGNRLAAEALPELSEVAVADDGSIHGPLPRPLSDVPRHWLARALTEADRALTCY